MTLLLTQPNASYRGKYYRFDDVTIDPRGFRSGSLNEGVVGREIV